MTDPLAEVRRIYAFLGREPSSEAMLAMQRHKALHAREKRAAHAYSLERFGYTRELVAEAFAAYRERFGGGLPDPRA